MTIEDTTDATRPDSTPTDQADAAAAVDAGAGAESGEDGGDPAGAVTRDDNDQDSLEAFAKGVATVTPEAPEILDAVDTTAADVAAKAKDAAGAPTPSPTADDPNKTAATDADIDREVQELGLKGRTEVRFREMASTIKEVEPLREAFAKHQITDAAKVDEVMQTVARAVEWENTIHASTATPEQFATAMGAIRALNSSDIGAKNKAFDSMLDAVRALGKDIGREVPGLFDPLDDHPELKAEVENGDLSRQRALEIVAQRAAAAANTARDTQNTNLQQHQDAINQAVSDLARLNEELKGADPDFARKLPMLQPTLDVIRETLHPSRWLEAIAKAYRALPALPAASTPTPTPTPTPAPRVPISHMPVRPIGGSAAMHPRPKDDLEAFKLGVSSLKRD